MNIYQISYLFKAKTSVLQNIFCIYLKTLLHFSKLKKKKLLYVNINIMLFHFSFRFNLK